MQTIHNKETK